MSEYSLTKHRGNWTVTFRAGERRLRISTSTPDRGLAEARAKAIWKARTATPQDRVRDIWPNYVADRIRDGARADRFKANWSGLEPHFGHRLGTAVSRDDCRDYWQARKLLGYSDSTTKTDLELLRACLRWRYGAEAPTLWIAPAAKPRDRWLTKEEARTLVDRIGTPHIKLFITLGLTTGARAGALLDLTWERVNFGNSSIDFMPAGRNQTNKRRTVVPMNAMARKALLEAHAGRLSDHVIEFNGKPIKSVKKALQRLDVTPHVLRHTAAVWMAQADVPMQKIAQYLGHSSTRVTEAVYARYSPSFMKDASDALEW